MNKEKINKEEKFDVEYIVRLNEDRIESEELGYMFRETCCYKLFKGKLLQQGGPLIFELSGTNSIAVVPSRWIAWMAPVKTKEK